jgi:hypothetical protein
MTDRVTPPRVDEIFVGEPTPHPLDALSAVDLASGTREAYEQAVSYRQLAQTLLDALHHVIAERDVLRDEVRRLREGRA